MSQLFTWDLDGVIADCVTVMAKRMNEELDIRKVNHPLITFDSFYGWTYTADAIGKYSGDENLAKEIENLFFDPEFLFLSEIFEGTEVAFTKIKKLDLRHQIVTSRPSNCAELTLRWLEKSGLVGYFEKINIRNDETDGRDFKIRIIEEKGAVLHFDDDPRIVERLDQGWLVDRPWNRQETKLDKKRVRGWKEIIAKIEAVCRR